MDDVLQQVASTLEIYWEEKAKEEEEKQRYHKLSNMVSSSYPHVRRLFQTRWKAVTGKDWIQPSPGQELTEPENEQVNDLLYLLKSRKVSLDRLQKQNISSACLDNWDITTISKVLLVLGDPTKYESEHKLVRDLTSGFRNDWAHHPSHRLTVEEFNTKEHLFRDRLSKLGVDDKEINKMIEMAGVTSSFQAYKDANKKFEEAKQFVSESNFEKAIKCIDEAADIPSLLPIHKGVVFQTRADYYLQFARYTKKEKDENEWEEYCDKAEKDATLAFNLNDNSWKACDLLGQCCQMKGNFAKAIFNII